MNKLQLYVRLTSTLKTETKLSIGYIYTWLNSVINTDQIKNTEHKGQFTPFQTFYASFLY